jgi:hypothetical protein
MAAEIKVDLGSNYTGATITADVLRDGTLIESVSMTETSNGHFAGTLTKTVSGVYSVEFSSGATAIGSGEWDPRAVYVGRAYSEAEPTNLKANTFNWGNRDNHLSIPVIDHLRVANSWSITSWVRAEGDFDSATAPRSMILEHSYNGSQRIALRFATHADGGKFIGIVYDGSFASSWTNNSRLFQDGNWHLVVFTNANKTLQLIVDGVDLSVAAAASAQVVAQGGKLGYEGGISRLSAHQQGDTRVYNHVLTDVEISSLLEAGPEDSRTNPVGAPTGIIARWHPDRIRATTEPDWSGNSYDGTWQNYDRAVYEKVSFRRPVNSIFAVGNSLTLDAEVKSLGLDGQWSINNAETLIFAAANPSTDTYAGSIPWGNVLPYKNFDVLSLQPYQDSPAQTIADEVAAAQIIIDEQPSGIILIHEGWAIDSVTEAGTEIDATNDGTFKYSNACIDEFVRQVKANNPDRKVVRSKTLQAINQVRLDIAAGRDTGAITEIGGDYGDDALYRDSFHLNYLHGRYLAHHCCRRSLGDFTTNKGYPFTGNSFYDPPGSATIETLEYLDTVLERVLPSDIATSGIIRM